MKKLIFSIAIFLIPGISLAQSLALETGESLVVTKARVIDVVSNEESGVFYETGKPILIQTVQAEILEGSQKGSIIELKQDYLGLKKGDRFLVEQYTSSEGAVEYTLVDFDRRGGILWSTIGFVLLILVFAKWQGFRSILSLLFSLLVIVYVLVPLLLRGAPPILTSVVIATLLLAIAIFLTHGFNRRSLIAFSGTVATVFVTGILASIVVAGSHLTGFSGHESTYLDFNTNGELNFVGLLLAGIIIGVLGVLDDISITQVAVVRELYSANPSFSRYDVFTRALRVGKEHVAALVNTLVFAYVGVSLPLLLYVSTLGVSDVGLVLNSEIFATEIARTIIGSIGLILSVPFTTFLAAIFLEKTKGKPLSEKEKHEGCNHDHSHHH